jgi:hypothetical protein
MGTLERAPMHKAWKREAADIITLLMSLTLISWSISLSESMGRLSRPPEYDDVSYMLASFNLYQVLLNSGPWQFIRLLSGMDYAHSPIQSFLGVAGYWLFGVSDLSVYLMNGVVTIAFTIVVVWFTRNLRPLVRIVLTALILSTPFMMALITEFRPDLYWGLLCGVAICLLMDHNFLAGNRLQDSVTALATALALLAKPTASPATAVLLAVATFAALGCRWRETAADHGSIRMLLGRFLAFAGVVLIIVAPYFAENGSVVYNYIIEALAQGEIYRPPGSFWDHLLYYSFGDTYRLGLYHALWIGIFFAAVNFLLMWRRQQTNELRRLICYVGVVTVAYLVPTASPIKSYFLGGMFYGTFLLFTLTMLSRFFESLEDAVGAVKHREVLVKYAALGILLLAALTSVNNLSLATVNDPLESADVKAVNGLIIGALSSAAANRNSPVTIDVPAADPINSDYVALAQAIRNIDVEVEGLYYVDSLEEQEAYIDKADYVILSNHSDLSSPGALPGAKLTPQLLNYVKERGDLREIAHYKHSDGTGTYLFERVGEATH